MADETANVIAIENEDSENKLIVVIIIVVVIICCQKARKKHQFSDRLQLDYKRQYWLAYTEKYSENNESAVHKNLANFFSKNTSSVWKIILMLKFAH